MARTRRSRKAKHQKWQIVGALVLFGMIAGGWYWWHMRHWVPEASAYPEQGIEIFAASGAVDFTAARALGAKFVYIEASIGATGKDPNFSSNLEHAREAGLQVGAVHRFDPCSSADGQSANFVTLVPRGEGLLQPAIALAKTAQNCPTAVSEAAIESELMTLINQIEKHAGRPVILKIMPGFEKEYQIASRIERNLWLVRTGREPDYAGRPWLLWTANESLRSEISPEPIAWVVVQP